MRWWFSEVTQIRKSVRKRGKMIFRQLLSTILFLGSIHNLCKFLRFPETSHFTLHTATTFLLTRVSLIQALQESYLDSYYVTSTAPNYNHEEISSRAQRLKENEILFISEKRTQKRRQKNYQKIVLKVKRTSHRTALLEFSTKTKTRLFLLLTKAVGFLSENSFIHVFQEGKTARGEKSVYSQMLERASWKA